MFRARTLFVLGAGASFEVGLPIGDTLLAQITNILNFRFDFGRPISGDAILLESLKEILNEGHEVERLNQHLIAGHQLRNSAQQAISIDNVIDALEDEKVELMGKLGIVRAILRSESSSSHFRPKQEHRDALDISAFSNTWYSSLTKLLTENVKKSEISNIFDNIEIINFNYDRCIERYIPESVANYYGITPAEVEKIMPNLKIHRPYGMCGRLPWMQGPGPIVQFGQNSSQNIAQSIAQIHTFTEQIEDGEELDAIRESVKRADRIVFLGFAFHRQNVRLISATVQDHTEILATTLGISKSDQEIIEREIGKAFDIDTSYVSKERIEMAQLTCSDFFKQYWRTMTAEIDLD